MRPGILHPYVERNAGTNSEQRGQRRNAQYKTVTPVVGRHGTANLFLDWVVLLTSSFEVLVPTTCSNLHESFFWYIDYADPDKESNHIYELVVFQIAD